MNWVYYLFCLKLYRGGKRTSVILWNQVSFMFPGSGNKEIFDFYTWMKR